jgi:hypothetical protein
MTATTLGTTLLLLAAFAYVARVVLAYTPVRLSANAALFMTLCVFIGLGLFVVGGML